MRKFLTRVDLLFHSIRLRLALWFVFILGLILIIFSSLVYVSQVRELRAESVTRLAGRWEEIEKFFVAAPFNPLEADNLNFGANPGGDNILYRDEEILALYNADQILQRQWGPLSELPSFTFPAQGSNRENETPIRYTSITSKDQRMDYAFLIAPLLSRQNLQGFIVIGIPFDPSGQRQRLLVILITFVSGMLIVALAGGFWLADRAMRPVKFITQTARQIGETDLSQRFNLKKKDEIGQLADTFDAMLARLEAAFARQRQFTADASHELRTPLTIVNLEAERALSTLRSPKEYQRVLQVIQSENDLMSHLVNDLLTLARMDAGRESLQKEKLDLSDLALDVVERLEPLAARQKVTLETGDLPEVFVLGDRNALMQALTNLVENAIKYTSQNDANHNRRVLIATGTHPARTLAWARVSDTGPGIPAEHIAHLFDRFYRVDKSRTRDEDPESPAGNGLGLAIVDGIARLHGGSVEVTSASEQGTTFEILLPLFLP